MNGSALLAEYRESGSETAFADLVRQYTNLVYSVARRRLSNAPEAEDVVQTVFVRLAVAKPKLSGDAELSAWLHRTTLHVAVDAWRRESRRRNREQQSLAMEPAAPEIPEAWEGIAPALDAAIDQMGQADRQALLLRFFHRKSMREVGEALGVNENAAKMRVSRALERLRTGLVQRGATCTAAALATLMLARAVEAAPEHLARRLATVRLLPTGAATGTFGIFSFLYPLLMLMSKSKLATLIVIGALGLTLVAIQSTQHATSLPTATGEVTRTILRRPRTTAPAAASLERFRSRPEVQSAPDSNAVEAAKNELRALLNHPPQVSTYPPRQLSAVLAKFGDRWLEAMPILLERLDTPDFETRRWALFGLSRLLAASSGTESFAAGFALARPKLAAIFRSEEEPNDLRRVAFEALVPSGLMVSSEGPRYALLDADTLADLTSVFRSPDKTSQGLRFEWVDALVRRHLPNASVDAQPLRDVFLPLLQQGDIGQRFLAAYALASLPGEKPPVLKSIFLDMLALRGTPEGVNSYYAARGLGSLGPAAQDTVPALLEFARATATWGDGGYAQSALEAACRIQPQLRSQYPEIDAKLKLEAEAASAPKVSTQVKTISPSEIASTLADPVAGPQMLNSFAIQARNSPQQKSQMLVFLESVRQQADESQRAAVQNSIDKIRALPDMPDTPEEAPKIVQQSLTTLTMEARIMLQDNANANADRLEALFDQWNLQSRNNPAESKATPERFQALSEAIKEIDPAFQAAWLKQILKTYPNLDRMARHEP